jgi:peroxiredoxin
MRRRLITGTGLALALACAAGCLGDGGAGVKVGELVPKFSLTTADDQKLTEGSLAGQIVILNFWSTSCPSCVREVEGLQRLAEGGRVKVVGIALDAGGWKAVRPFLAKHGVTYPVALGDEALFQRFDGISIPHTLVLDRAQRVVKVYRAGVTRETLEKVVGAIEGGGG